jgi:hypothetical protein
MSSIVSVSAMSVPTLAQCTGLATCWYSVHGQQSVLHVQDEAEVQLVFVAALDGNLHIFASPSRDVGCSSHSVYHRSALPQPVVHVCPPCAVVMQCQVELKPDGGFWRTVLAIAQVTVMLTFALG